MTNNQDFAHLIDELPPAIARRKAMGDLQGALRLIDQALASGRQPELAPRLRAERVRLERLPGDYPYTRAQALDMIRAEWPDCTEAQFDALLDNGRIDWRMIDGQLRCHDRFLESVRLYPAEAPGLRRSAADNRAREEMLSRMHTQGELSARITIQASIRSLADVAGKDVQAWLPLPAACPQQSEIEILEATPGGVPAPEDAPQRTIWWQAAGRDAFSVTYRYVHRAVYVDPMTLTPDPVQPTFDVEQQAPHIVFTPYLKALAARITQGCSGPVEKARAIYDYVTGYVDYRFQPAYLQLESIADQCARELRGDCGVFAILFITLCRICGIPARWQSGLYAQPTDVGCHDWAMFYIAPHGWLWADCSFGSAARRTGQPERRAHYFGNLDPWRMVANSALYAPLTPPMTGWRQDPYDNQRGEIMVDGQGLDDSQRACQMRVVAYEEL
ncbi:MAG: transglutaminase-like domain-containing protein [Christensenellales bacterium]|jgi:transglutaminase-like putative cysteine protease